MRTTVALDARLDDWAIERQRKRRALDAEKTADTRREHIRKAKRRVVTAFREVVERGIDPEFLELAESLMESDHYDDDLFELPFTEALAIIADDLRGEPNTFPNPEPAEADEAAPRADRHFPDPKWPPSPIDEPAPPGAPPAARRNGHDPPP